MRIFIGYHYAPSDAWVKNLVYRLVRAFGDEIESGEHLYLTPSLAEGIIEKIQACDALVGVASRRDQLANGLYTTHTWVKDELTVARTANKLFVQLRETGLDPQQGILEGAQYIEYDRTNLGECLVKLAEALGQWHSLRNVPLYLLPSDFAAAVTPLLEASGFYCRFRILDQNYDEKLKADARPVPTPGGLLVMLRGIPRGNFIQIEAGHGNKRWKSDVVSIESPTVTMKPL